MMVGCASGPAVKRHALTSSTEATSAFALPPPGGPAVVAVIERTYANAVEQDIVLASDTAVAGQNMLSIQLFGQVGEVGRATRASDPVLAEANIGRDLRTLFPGVAMVRSPLYAQNSYGPFGYAVGRHPSGDMCLYGWQRIANSRSGPPFTARGSIQVRLRLCQREATERSLLAAMYGYTISASLPGGWNPYGSVPAPDPRIGETGQPIYPIGGSWVDAVSEPPVQPRRLPVRRVVQRSTAQQAIPVPPPDAPVVPSPPPVLDSTPSVPPPPISG